MISYCKLASLLLASILFPSLLTAQTVEVSLSAPASTTESSFEVTAQWQASQSSLKAPYLDISFPQSVSGVEVVDQSTGWESVTVYKPGDQIYHRDGSQIDAQYPLVSGTRSDYGGQELSVRLRVTVNTSGFIPIHYRGALGDGAPVDIDPQESEACATDQQGWPVYCDEVSAETGTLPDVAISRVEINSGDPVWSGESVDIDAWVRELNGEPAGQVDLVYRVDGAFIDDDKSSFLDAGDSDHEATSYIFPSGGQYTIEVEADPDDVLVEADESNNVLSKEISVTQSALDIVVSPNTDQTLDRGESVAYQITVTDGSNPVEGATVGVDDGLAGVSTEAPLTDRDGSTTYTATVVEGAANSRYDISFQASKVGYEQSNPSVRQILVERNKKVWTSIERDEATYRAFIDGEAGIDFNGKVLTEAMYSSSINSVYIEEKTSNYTAIVSDIQKQHDLIATVANKVIMDSPTWSPHVTSLIANQDIQTSVSLTDQTGNRYFIRSLIDLSDDLSMIRNTSAANSEGLDTFEERFELYKKVIRSIVYFHDEKQFEKAFARYGATIDGFSKVVEAGGALGSGIEASMKETLPPAEKGLSAIEDHLGNTIKVSKANNLIEKIGYVTDAIGVLGAGYEQTKKNLIVYAFLTEVTGAKIESIYKSYQSVPTEYKDKALEYALKDVRYDYWEKYNNPKSGDWTIIFDELLRANVGATIGVELAKIAAQKTLEKLMSLSGAGAGAKAYLILAPWKAGFSLMNSRDLVRASILASNLYHVSLAALENNSIAGPDSYTTTKWRANANHVRALAAYMAYNYVVEYLDGWLVNIGVWLRWGSTSEAKAHYEEKARRALKAAHRRSPPWFIAGSDLGESGEDYDHRWLIAKVVSGSSEEETVSTPLPPAIQSYNAIIIVSSGGATSNLEYPVEYKFDCGNGTESIWRGENGFCLYQSTGNYPVRVKARSKINPSVESTWSKSVAHTVYSTEAVSRPDAPSGPSSGEVGEELEFTAGSSSSSSGTSLEHRFDWGDGNISDWGEASRSHGYAESGNYTVHVRARIAGNPYSASLWSEGKMVSVENGLVPSKPTGLIATAGDGRVELSWEANSESDLAGYNLYQSTASFSAVSNATKLNASPIPGTAYADEDVTNGTSYYYRVTAVDGEGNESGLSREVNATPSSDPGTGVTREVLANLPQPMLFSLSSYSTVDGKLHVFGGFEPGTDPYQAYDTVWRFDLASGTWSDLGITLPYGIFDYHTTGIFHEDHFYLPPGFASGNTNGWGSHNQIIDVDLASGSASETAAFSSSSRIWNIASVKAGDKIYYLGGHTGSDMNEIFEFDPERQTLTQVATMSFRANGTSATVGADGWIYYWAPGDSRKIERFNPSTYAVETMNAELPSDLSRWTNLWHIAGENAFYLFGAQVDPAVYKYDYANDVVSETGWTVPGDYRGRVAAVQDATQPHVIYAFERNGAPESNPLVLTKITLPAGDSDINPAVPTGLSVALGDGSVELTWNANSEDDWAGYNLYRATTSFGSISEAERLNGGLITDPIYIDTEVSVGEKYYYRVTAVDEGGNESRLSQEVSVLVSDELAAYYPFDGNADDTSGREHDGTVYGATLTTDRFGGLNSAYEFDGSDDYIDVSVLDTELETHQKGSLSLWLRVNNVRRTEGQMVFHHSYPDGGTWGVRNLGLLVRDGRMEAFARDTKINGSYPFVVWRVENTTPLVDGTWYHIALTHDGNETLLYVNGSAQQSQYIEEYDRTAWFADIDHQKYQVDFGSLRYEGYERQAYLEGVLDDIKVFDRALTGAEVQELAGSEEWRATVEVTSETTGLIFEDLGMGLYFTRGSSTDGKLAVTRFDKKAPNNENIEGSATSDDGTTIVPDAASEERYYTVSNSGLSRFEYRVCLDISGLPGADEPVRLVILKRENSEEAWTPYDTVLDGDQICSSGLSSFSEFTVGGERASNPLPVELVDFTASADERNVVLQWRTESEKQNAGFDVERRVGPDSFEKLAFIDGAGTTNEPQTYRFDDVTVPFDTDVVTYRLKQIDLDGAHEYSEEVEVDLHGPPQLRLHKTFPNPAASRATLRYELPHPGLVRISLYNTLGQRVLDPVNRVMSAGRHQRTLDLNQLGSGLYFVRIETESGSITRKLVVVR